MKGRFVPFLLGVVFALGLGISGMTDPRKIIAFLNVAGAWDPSLAFVMIGAVAVHFGFAQWALRAKKPAWAPAFFLATKTTIGAPLVTGAAIFGLGWGAAGYCPGPAVVAASGGSVPALLFLGSMLAGIAVFRWIGVPSRRPGSSRLVRSS
jgi:uncharacterized membrane protein YedE/YeeE